jgi:hypothetical protein
VGRFADGFDMAMATCAGLLVVGAALAWVLLGEAAPASRPVKGVDRTDVSTPTLDVSKCVHCGVNAPQLAPRDSTVHR